MTIQIDLKIGIGYRSHANFGVGDQNLSGIPPMSPPDSQLMAPITTDSLNFTNNTEESGNSLAKAVLPTHVFFNFSDFFINF
jgi:hypothetical protein